MASRSSLGLVALALVAACQRTSTERKVEATEVAKAQPAKTTPPPEVARSRVAPPLPVAAPPADAEQLTGLADAPQAIVYVKRLTVGSGARPGRNDTISVNLNGWRLDGETFMTTKTRNRPVQQSLAMLAPGFAAAVQTMRAGERAMIWVPPQLGYMGPPQATPETTVYEVELVSFESAPPTPPDAAAPPPSAERSRSGLASLVVKPGTGTAKPRNFDDVSFHYTAWDAGGRMFDSSELRKRPKETIGFREWPGIEEALTLMVVGERRRVWIPPALADTSLPGLPKGVLCYELELLTLTPLKPPPAAPSDLTARPADAQQTASGVFYKVLKRGTGTSHPTRTDRVKVNYTGWRLDGRVFDSSVVRGIPAEFVVGKLVAGWTDGLQTMVVGDKTRLWVPVALAFKGEPGRPAGDLVFDIELLAILPGTTPPPKAPVGAMTPAPPEPSK